MGSRKGKMAENMKENNKNLAVAKLNNCPTSPRKMRIVARRIFIFFDYPNFHKSKIAP